ncbi:hypothetical protein B9Z55_025277 [Caenorhabditis nigoni]|uniref:Uncharacterized protein n=1 Tax=Caenorhabditis nigoni TaxID=1611254 RepID=A0A2G5SYA0_9PELO|nr:hypothetical protein B9Z55_025277 [Caenorhabditis nigoni]
MPIIEKYKIFRSVQKFAAFQEATTSNPVEIQPILYKDPMEMTWISAGVIYKSGTDLDKKGKERKPSSVALVECSVPIVHSRGIRQHISHGLGAPYPRRGQKRNSVAAVTFIYTIEIGVREKESPMISNSKLVVQFTVSFLFPRSDELCLCTRNPHRWENQNAHTGNQVGFDVEDSSTKETLKNELPTLTRLLISTTIFL